MSDSKKGIPFLTGSDFDSRMNVAWRVELGRPDSANPLIEPEMPWDSGHPILHGTVLRDPIDGLWKAWGTAAPGDGLVMQERRLTYFESDDGRDWRRPELGLHRYGSHERTNILLDLDSGGNCSYASVLVVPDAPEPRRYQMFLLRRPGEPERLEGIGVVKGFRGPDGSEPRAWGVYCYCSGDGLRWEPDVGPVLVNDPDALRSDGTSDSAFIHRSADGSFAAYHKSPIAGFPGSVIPYELGAGACRVLVQRTSEDGIDWNRHEPCMMPDWRDPGDTQFMEMSVTPAAGGWIGIVTVYRAASQTLELQFAASRDGRHWWRPDRRPCLSLPPVGDYGGGMMWGTHHMVADGADWHYYYSALQGIHGDMLSTEEAEFAVRHGRAYRSMPPLYGESLSRSPDLLSFHGALCRATWQRDRLWALTTASGGNLEGLATTPPASREGEVLDISASTFGDGEVLVELIDADGSAVPGYGRDDCGGFSGDASRSRLTWGGRAACPADGLKVRFILRRARLYGYEFRPQDP